MVSSGLYPSDSQRACIYPHFRDYQLRIRNDTGGKYLDPKSTAKTVFQALCDNARALDLNLNADAISDVLASLELTLVLGILPSGASVLLLSYSQVFQVCAFHDCEPPNDDEGLPSSRFESLSPITFVGFQSLATKLRLLSPKSGHHKGDTSQNNRQFALQPHGDRRGLFENLRVLRHVASRQIGYPPTALPVTPSSLIHPPFARYSLRKDIHMVIPRVRVATFAYTLWNGVDMRPFEEKTRSPVVLEVGWAQSKTGMQDLEVSTDDGGSQEVVFGWNRSRTQLSLPKKSFPNSAVLEDKGAIGATILQQLFQQSYTNQQDHLVLLLYDEPKVCALFQNLGVDLLSGCFDSGSGTKFRWSWLKQNRALKDLLRDVSVALFLCEKTN